jgi:hypothetical protein
MAKYKKFNDGMQLVDQILALDGYNYYGYVRWGRNTQWMIMREKTDQTEYRFKIGASDYATNWANKDSLTGWKRPDEFSIDT